MEQKSAGLLIAAFAMIIMGTVLLVSVATNTNAVTGKTGVASETISLIPARVGTGINVSYQFNLVNSPTGWKLNDCPVSNYKFYNQSGIAAVNLLTENTHYYFTPKYGNFTYQNCSTCVNLTATNTTYVSYDYCADGYVNSDFGRTSINLVPGFFALAILGIGVGLIFAVLKREGLLGI